MMVDKKKDALLNTLNSEKCGSSSFDKKNETIVFVSYIREDHEAAKQLCLDLKNANLNLKPWIDTEILAGQRWDKEIKKAIQKSRYFIPLISLRAVEKGGYTRHEFKYALDVIKETQRKHKIIIIPVRLNDCKIPYSQLEKIQYVDLFPDWKEGFEKILQAIKQGDNLVGGRHQFEEEETKFGTIRKLPKKFWPLFNDDDSDMPLNPSLSSSMLLVLDSNMVIDKNSITNPRYSNFHVPYSFSSCLGFKDRTSGSKDGQFKNPTGIAIDGSSNYVYVADKENHRIQKFDSDGRFIAKWGSKGSSDGQFKNPTGIAIDPLTNHVYVADKENRRIQKFHSDGRFIAKWGSKGSIDGQFDNPVSLCINRQNGCIFVVESNNHRIQLFVIPPADEWIRKGTLFLSLHKYDEALQCFQKAIEIDQKYAYAWINKGASFYQLGKYDEALQCFQKAIEIDQKYAYAWINKGKSLIHTGRYQDAIKSFDKSIEINQDDAEGWINMGLTYYLLNQYDRAIKCFNQILQTTPRNDGALYFRGCSNIKKGRVEEGTQDISNAIKINSKLITTLKDESGLESITERLQVVTGNTVEKIY